MLNVRKEESIDVIGHRHFLFDLIWEMYVLQVYTCCLRCDMLKIHIQGDFYIVIVAQDESWIAFGKCHY